MRRDLQQRIASNESVFRDVNEAIARGQWPGELDAPIGFRCECARLGCNRLIELTMREYQNVRAHPRRFVVAVGHQLADAETVVQTLPDYLVVEKVGEGGRVAESLDPRT